VAAGQESDNGYVFTVSEEDMEKRIELAGLTEMKAEKFRNTLKMLELSDKGLRTADIAKALGISVEAVRVLRRSAASTIREVQDKINRRIEKYPENSKGQGRPPADGKRKTLGANPGPAHKSIVEPYRDIVVEMWNSGKSHHQIHPAIVEKGFSGCKAAVYQYICKLENEEPCALTRKMKQKEPGTPWVDNFDKQEAQNLPDLTLEKVTRNSLYNSILKEGRETRESEVLSETETLPESEIKPESSMEIKKDADLNDKEDSDAKPAVKSNKPAMAKYSPLDPEILDLMYGKDEVQPKHEPNAESKSDEHTEKKHKL
jgi:DNA-directed RNA polymerase specialized sigma24 family protein